MRAWLIDPLSQPIVRPATYSDDLKMQAVEMLNQFQNYNLPPRIGRRLINGDLLLVSEETWRVHRLVLQGVGARQSILQTAVSRQLSQRWLNCSQLRAGSAGATCRNVPTPD
jgi:hypothetical protein